MSNSHPHRLLSPHRTCYCMLVPSRVRNGESWLPGCKKPSANRQLTDKAKRMPRTDTIYTLLDLPSSQCATSSQKSSSFVNSPLQEHPGPPVGLWYTWSLRYENHYEPR
jgi:hypothetical protein